MNARTDKDIVVTALCEEIRKKDEIIERLKKSNEGFRELLIYVSDKLDAIKSREGNNNAG